MDISRVPDVLQWQADSIDRLMASLGLVGGVTGGTVTGNRQEPTTAHYTWEAGVKAGSHGQVTGPPRLGKASIMDLERALLEELGPGVTWKSEGSSLVVSAPLREASDVAGRVLPASQQDSLPASQEGGRGWPARRK